MEKPDCYTALYMVYTGGITLQVPPHLAMVCDHSNGNTCLQKEVQTTNIFGVPTYLTLSHATLKIRLRNSNLYTWLPCMHQNNQWIVVLPNIHCSHICSTVAVQLATQPLARALYGQLHASHFSACPHACIHSHASLLASPPLLYSTTAWPFGH